MTLYLVALGVVAAYFGTLIAVAAMWQNRKTGSHEPPPRGGARAPRVSFQQFLASRAGEIRESSRAATTAQRRIA